MANWLKFLVPISFVLVLVWFGLNFVPRLTSPKINDDFLKETGDLKKETIENIIIRDEEGTAEVTKVNGEWRLDDRKVVSSKIDEILNSFFNPKNTFVLVSQNQNAQTELGVASPSARRVAVKDGKRNRVEFIVGNYSFPGNFVRIEGSGNTYLSPVVLEAITSSDPQNLWDKTIFAGLIKEAIQKITLKNAGLYYTIVKESDKFYLEKFRRELDASKVNEYLSTLENLRGDKIMVDKNEKKKYPKILGEIYLEAANQKETVKLYSGRSENLLERASDGELFTLPSSRTADLIKSQAEFYPAP